jgi:2-C-methyl-D-erythritol 4-phosphate cytidylyltransferase
MDQITALIMAAGTGERFGSSDPKQFSMVRGNPILVWAVKRFSQAEFIAHIILVVTPGLEKRATEIVDSFHLKKVDNIVAGGETRQDSVKLGLESVPDSTEFVLVHDAVRPCVSSRLIVRVCAALQQNDAVVPVIPAVDTLVREVEGEVDAILDRNRIKNVQTPQAFRRELLIKAHRRAASRRLKSSDDGSLVLAMGQPVKTVAGETSNIKVTYPEDVSLAEAILSMSG